MWFYLKQSKSSQPLRVSPRVYFWRPRALRSSCTVSGAPCRTETCMEIQKTQDGFPSQCEGNRWQIKERTNEMRIRCVSIKWVNYASFGSHGSIELGKLMERGLQELHSVGKGVFSVQLISAVLNAVRRCNGETRQMLSASTFPLLSLLFHRSNPPQESVKTFC